MLFCQQNKIYTDKFCSVCGFFCKRGEGIHHNLGQKWIDCM